MSRCTTWSSGTVQNGQNSFEVLRHCLTAPSDDLVGPHDQNLCAEAGRQVCLCDVRTRVIGGPSCSSAGSRGSGGVWPITRIVNPAPIRSSVDAPARTYRCVICGSFHLEPMAGSDHNGIRVSARPAAVATAKASCTPASTPFSKSSPVVAIVLVT